MDMNNAIGAPVPGRAAAEIGFLSVRSAPPEQPHCWAGLGGPGPCCCPWGLPVAGGGTRGSASQPPADGSTLSALPGASPALSLSPAGHPSPTAPCPGPAGCCSPPAPSSPARGTPARLTNPRPSPRPPSRCSGKAALEPEMGPRGSPPACSHRELRCPSPTEEAGGERAPSSLALRSAARWSRACFGGAGELFSPGLQAFVLCPLLAVVWHLPLRAVTVATRRWRRALVPSPVPERGWLPARVPGHTPCPRHVPQRQLLLCARGTPAAPPLRPGALKLSVALPIAAALLLPQPRTSTR